MSSLRPPAARCLHGVLHEHSWDRPHPEHHAQPWRASCAFASSSVKPMIMYETDDLVAVASENAASRSWNYA